jgi:heme/copper-type cytochrome/quinol oxidase subunit 3
LGEIGIVIILFILSEISVFAAYFAIEKVTSMCSKKKEEQPNKVAKEE